MCCMSRCVNFFTLIFGMLTARTLICSGLFELFFRGIFHDVSRHQKKNSSRIRFTAIITIRPRMNIPIPPRILISMIHVFFKFSAFRTESSPAALQECVLFRDGRDIFRKVVIALL